MKLTTIREIYKNREAYLDKEVTVGGWVRSVRDSKLWFHRSARRKLFRNPADRIPR